MEPKAEANNIKAGSVFLKYDKDGRILEESIRELGFKENVFLEKKTRVRTTPPTNSLASQQ